MARLYGSLLAIPPALALIAERSGSRTAPPDTAAAIDRLTETLGRLATPPAAPAPVVKTVDIYDRLGLKLLLDRSSLVDLRVIEDGRWEPAQTGFLMNLIRNIRQQHDPVFLDLGAYWGLYSLLAMREGVRRIHAFDADRHNFAQLQAQIFLNDAAGRITPHHRAVSAGAGVLHCWDSRSHPDGNRGGVGILGGNSALQPTHEIASVSIDEHLPFEDEYLVIKLDVEGHEDQALRGLRSTVARNRVVMQVEIFDHSQARVLPVIEELGLRRFHAIEPDYYYTNMSDEALAA